jgi:hypothetical protein
MNVVPHKFAPGSSTQAWGHCSAAAAAKVAATWTVTSWPGGSGGGPADHPRSRPARQWGRSRPLWCSDGIG